MLFMVRNMKKLKLEMFTLPNRLTLIKFFTVMILLMLFTTFEIPLAFKAGFGSKTVAIGFLTNTMPPLAEQNHQNNGPFRLPLKKVSTLSFNNSFEGVSKLYKVANHAYISGKKLWEEVESGKVKSFLSSKVENGSDSCLNSFSVSGIEFKVKLKGVMVLPCGLTLWSHVTVVGTPHWVHGENDSQFMIELQGLKSDDNEKPPRILHFNPRLKGDWSGKPVIELNTCYKSNWGTALRCEGWKSRVDEETVDGHVKCEKWIHDDDNRSEGWKATWWLNRLMGQKMVMPVDWPYPFVEGKLFALTISAGLEGYQINVNGRHMTSFPYRAGFALEDAVGLAINGDVDVHSIYVASLPTSHPRYARQMHLELLPQWKAPPILGVNVELFIGIISAGNHFAERMAVRKSWMQHKLIKSSNVVARFFVALHGKKDINVEIKKEAEYFGDIIIVPYMDHYHLVVLKTIAICEYGIGTVAAKYIMKCDDDTFVRVDSVISEARQVPKGKSLYMGHMIYHPKPLHNGKWAVTYEEWAEDVYPIYACGPGYIVSSDIARFIVSEFEQQKLKLFKMEDVSMGMWVEQFNNSREVEYVHSSKFCKSGCIENYYTAHYQSPRQMECMWEKLQHQRKPLCCNMR